MNLPEKLKILTPLQKLPKNVGDLGKLIVATGFEKLCKVQQIAKSGHLPAVKNVWKVAMHVQHNLFCLCHKHNSLPLGPIQPSSPSTKELHELANPNENCFHL